MRYNSLAVGLLVSSSPYAAVYHGVWGYNGFLAAGSISFFMVPKLHILLLAAINAVFATFIQSALGPVYAAVSVNLVDQSTTMIAGRAIYKNTCFRNGPF